MFAGIDRALIRDLAAIEPVLQHQIERAAATAPGRHRPSRPARMRRLLLIPASASSASSARTDLSAQIALKDVDDDFGLGVVDDEACGL